MTPSHEIQYPTDNKSTVFILLAFALIMFGFAVIFNVLMTNRSLSKENNTYLRLNACIVSVPPQTRTADYVKHCYATAEQQGGRQVDRFGYGKE
jgi:hypothetical protein